MNTNPDAKRILCFGDSNTWGYVPNESTKSTYNRYPANVRYTGVLQDLLGKDYEVIEEGVASRTIKSIDPRPGKENRTALSYITQCLFVHDPLDYLVIFMGTNELKTSFNLTIEECLEYYDELIETITKFKGQKDGAQPQIIFVVPPPIDNSKPYAGERFVDGLERSKQFSELLEKHLKEKNLNFISCFKLEDLGSDGLHLIESGHRKLAEELHTFITKTKA